METSNYNWDATAFFRDLTRRNKFAINHHFSFSIVSGLEGFEEALTKMQSSKAFVCVSDVSQGSTELANSPHTRRTKTVFLAMRHPLNDMKARLNRYEIMRELFRQFMSVLILEKTALEQHCVFIDTRISFNEIEQFFFSGCACAFFNITVVTHTDLIYRDYEWEE